MQTWMCEHGHHGTPERREIEYRDGRPQFTYTGTCQGRTISIMAEVLDCSCSCHDRRDDITKPDTTYSFPRPTLSW